MKNLRRSIQGTIRRGNVVHAIVEDYSFGRATVRLTEGGSRLSNLSTLGYTVNVDDEVIVDYRAGVAPIVRPIFESEVEDEEVITLASAEPLGDVNEAEPGWELIGDKVKDIDCGLAWEHQVKQGENPVCDWYEFSPPPGFIGQKASPQNTDVFVIFGRPLYHQWPWTPDIIPVHMVYDTTNAFPETEYPGPDHVGITLGGKYLIWCWMHWYDSFSYGPYPEKEVNPKEDADFEIKLWKNGDVVARNSNRAGEMFRSSPNLEMTMATHQITAIVDCDPGDIIQMSIRQDYYHDYTDTTMHSGGWYFVDWEGYIGIIYDLSLLFTLQLIPQTQRS